MSEETTIQERKIKICPFSINKVILSGHVDKIKRFTDESGRDTLTFRLCSLNQGKSSNGKKKVFITPNRIMAQDKKAEIIAEWLEPMSHVIVEGKLRREGQATVVSVNHVQNFKLEMIELAEDIMGEESEPDGN